MLHGGQQTLHATRGPVCKTRGRLSQEKIIGGGEPFVLIKTNDLGARGTKVDKP